jgi:hypothetical protein
MTCLFAAIAALLTGCASDPAFWSGVAAGLGNAGAPTTVSRELLVFGGQGHDVFLGCLNCSEYASSSVLNQFGRFGSAYSSTSILNPYGQFGSKYSSFSACNEYALNPPVVVDQQGNFYGYLTLNQYKNPVNNGAIRAWLVGVCANH